MSTNGKTEAEIVDVMNKFTAAYERRDLQELLNCVAPDDDIFMFGTGSDEKRIGLEEFKYQAERDWSQMEELAFNFNSFHISAAGPVAWVASEGLGQGKVGGQEIEFPLRMTSVFKQYNNEWRLALAHVSVPAPGQEKGNSVPV